MDHVHFNRLINTCLQHDSGAVYLFQAELTSLQGLTEAYLPKEEATLVYQRGGLLEALTHWNAFGQVGMQADGDVVPDKKKRETYSVR